MVRDEPRPLCRNPERRFNHFCILLAGVLDMECHDRSFVIAVDLSFAGDDARFEAVGMSDCGPDMLGFGRDFFPPPSYPPLTFIANMTE